MDAMEYFVRWLKVNFIMFIRNSVRRYPITSVVSFIMLVIALYLTLDQFVWGHYVLNFITALLSSEALAYRLYSQSYQFWHIVVCFLVVDAITITFDILLINGLLKWRLFTSVIHAVVVGLKTFRSEVSKLFGDSNGMNQINRMKDHLNDLKKKPTKAGLFTIFCLGLMPRFPPLPGGVGIGIFILKYNQYAYIGWIVLILGMIIRHLAILGSIYGFSSLF
ncbi:MAG: hypothetical protein ACNFW9_03170 [Candidatus Kerfeldbacteria bacterium]